MPKFIIERNIPKAGSLSPDELRAISKKSREVLCKLGTDIQWIHSYVAGDKIYCIYIAPSKRTDTGTCPTRRVSSKQYYRNFSGYRNHLLLNNNLGPIILLTKVPLNQAILISIRTKQKGKPVFPGCQSDYI